MKKTIPQLREMADQRKRITMLTAYDYLIARLLERAEVDVILVGDSLGNVVLGYGSTVPVTMEDMLHHTKAVRRGAPNTFLITDMPFMSYASLESALNNAGRLIKEGGADAVKLEGGENYQETVNLLTRSGIPVVGHIGLTPQTATQLGGYKVQGKDAATASRLLRDAVSLEESGAIMLVLEAIPAKLAEKITDQISIPTIGIGAGDKCSGQVLVTQDLLGMYDDFVPKFVKTYENIGTKILNAVKQYCDEVKSSHFPAEEHSFSINDEVLNNIYYSGKD